MIANEPLSKWWDGLLWALWTEAKSPFGVVYFGLRIFYLEEKTNELIHKHVFDNNGGRCVVTIEKVLTVKPGLDYVIPVNKTMKQSKINKQLSLRMSKLGILFCVAMRRQRRRKKLTERKTASWGEKEGSTWRRLFMEGSKKIFAWWEPNKWLSPTLGRKFFLAKK